MAVIVLVGVLITSGLLLLLLVVAVQLLYNEDIVPSYR